MSATWQQFCIGLNVNTKQGTGNYLNLWRLYFLPVISQGSQPCLGYVNILHTCGAVDCLVAAWSLAKEFKFLATTKQLYEWSCPSFRHTHLSSGAIDTDRGNVHAKDQGQKSRSQRSKQILAQFEHVRTVTPVWIHIWQPNDAQSLKWHRKCALLFLAATKQIYEWFNPSNLFVCLSVCPSVRPYVRPYVHHIFLTMFPSSYHHEIFSSYYQWQKWRPCKKSRSEVKGQGHRGQHPT